MNVLLLKKVVDDFGYIPRFRSGPNLSILASGEFSTWSFKQNSYATNQDAISPFSNTGSNVALYLRYAYHINNISFFGFFISTTAGVIAEVEPYGKIKTRLWFLFPTLLGGLVANIGQHFRLFNRGIEYGATWYPEVEINHRFR